jgi:spermidine synthase
MAQPLKAGHKKSGRIKVTAESYQTTSLPWPLVVFAVSGFCSMAYEVLWTRLLGLIAGPTGYCFSIVVATFIIGLALGSILFGHLADRTKNPALWLIITQMGAAITAMAVSQLLGNSQFLFAKLIYVHKNQFNYLMLVQGLFLFTVLLAPTLFSGAAFPLVNKLYSRSLENIGRSLGTAYALNTLGALLGSFIAGFVLIPWLGKAGGLRLVILVQFSLSGLWLVYLNFRSKGRSFVHLAAIVVLIGGWGWPCRIFRHGGQNCFPVAGIVILQP